MSDQLRQAAETLQSEVLKLKQMLEQQAEPVADEWAKLLHYPDCWDTAAYPTLHDAVHEALAWSECSVCKLVQQAEPVAWVIPMTVGKPMLTTDRAFAQGAKTIDGKDVTPLCTATPQRQWVGLTDEELQFQLAKHHRLVNAHYDKGADTNIITETFDSTRFYNEVVAILKEKNA